MNACDPEESVAANDRESLERSLESFRAYLLFVACRLKGNRLAGREGPSDLVQQTILAAVEKIRDGNIPGPSDDHRKAWLRKILYNTLNRIVRHENAGKRGGGRVVGGLEEPGADPATSPSGVAIKNEESQLLADALAQLDPDTQALLRLRYVEKMTCEEIGRLRGCSASYASRICNEALGRLGKVLQG